jgi:hypothetical protein
MSNKTPRRPDRAPVTMDIIRSKCIEDGDCLVWQAGKSSAEASGIPYMKAEGKTVPVRRWIAENVLKLQVKGKLASTSCANSACVEPEHIAMKTRTKLQKDTVNRTLYHLNPVRNAKLAKAARARSPHPPEMVEKIRAAEGSHKAIARELGVSFDMVNRIKNGQSHRSYTNNPWAGL